MTSLVITYYIMIFIGIVFGWFIAALMASSKIQDLENELMLAKEKNNTSNKKKPREFTDDELF